MSSTIKKHPFGCFALSFRGFDPEYAEEWFYLKSIKKYALPNSIGVSHKDILSLLPFDARIDKSLLPSGEKTYQLFADRLSTRYALSRHRERTPEIYYVLLTKDGERFILPYGEAETLERSETGIAELIRRKGCVTVRPTARASILPGARSRRPSFCKTLQSSPRTPLCAGISRASLTSPCASQR